MKKCRETISILLALVLLITVLLAAGWLLLPKSYQAGIDWDAFLKEPENSIDVLYVGSSMAFCDVAPGVVYENCGVTGYVVAGPEQTIPVSYYYIREACGTQSPKAVFLELGGMFFTRYEEHTASNIAFMPRGMNRLRATFTAANRENIPRLIFPVLDYHSRWNSVTLEEIKDKLHTDISKTAGFQLQREAQLQHETSYRELTTSYYDYSLAYLERIAEFCAEKGIDLYLFFAPTMNRTPEELREKLEADIAALKIKDYVNFNSEDNFESLAFDGEHDWVDGLHLNVNGARKFSADIARQLTEAGYAPTEGEDEELWQMRIDALK